MTAERDLTLALASRLLDDLSALVARAASLILTFPHAASAQRIKPDGSPVTPADEASQALIIAGLTALLPHVPVISEERAHAATTDLSGSFVIVDPLDGTREYLAGRDEYTVNLALVRQGVPVAGIVAAPARGLLWRGIVGAHAERLEFFGGDLASPQKIRSRYWPAAGAVATVSRSHFDSATDAFLSRIGPLTREPCGSALKFCRLAEGSADVYPRLAPTSEWDVAAGHALLAAAGGVIVTPQGGTPAYGRARERFRVSSFLAWGDPAKSKIELAKSISI